MMNSSQICLICTHSLGFVKSTSIVVVLERKLQNAVYWRKTCAITSPMRFVNDNNDDDDDDDDDDET